MKGKKPYSKGSCRKVRGNPARQADEAIARELYLFIENDEILLTRRYPQFILNLERKMKRGVYDRERAVKLFMYLADEASKRYSKQFGDGKTHTADVPTRMLLAKMLRDRFESERRAMGIPAGAMPRTNPSPSAARLRRQAEIMEMDERLVPSTMTYEDIKDDPKLIAHYKKIMTPMAWKQLVDDWIRSGVRSGSGRRDFVIPKESEYRRMVGENPPPMFKSGGYSVVVTLKSGEVQIGDPFPTKEQAKSYKKYLRRGRGRWGNVERIEILPHTEVLRNPSQDQGDYNSPEVAIVYKAKYTDLGWQGIGGSVEKFANSLGGRGTGGGTDMRTGLRDKSFKFKTIAGAVKFATNMKPYALRISAERYNHDTMKREKLPIGKSR